MTESEGNHWNSSERRQWSVAMFLGCVALYSCRTVAPLCLAVMAKEFDWNKTQSGTVLGCFFWGYMMTQVLGGYLSDRIGGEVVLPVAALVYSTIIFLTPQLGYLSPDKQLTLYMFVGLRVILGLAQGFHVPSLTSLISKKVSEKERSSTYSFVIAGSPLGTLVSGSIGSILLEKFGWQIVFYFIGALSVLWALYVRFILIANYRYSSKHQTLPESGVKPVIVEKEPVPWCTLFKKAGFWSIYLGHFCHTNSFFILLSWAPTYFHENFPEAKGWVFNVVPWIVCIISGILGGKLADHLIKTGYDITFVRKAFETGSLVGTALGLTLLAYMTVFEGALLCVAFSLACCSLHNNGILINPQDVAPKHAGSVFGVMNMAGAIPGFVGVYMAGHTLEVTKSWAAVFYQTSFVCLVGWVIYLFFGTARRII